MMMKKKKSKNKKKNDNNNIYIQTYNSISYFINFFSIALDIISNVNVYKYNAKNINYTLIHIHIYKCVFHFSILL